MRTDKTMLGKQRGFSLIEMIVSMAVLLLVTGSVFQLLSQSQQRFVTASNVEESTASSRDALDQMIRELRLAGYPAPSNYPAGVIGPTQQDYVTIRGGFVAGTAYSVQFEADLDNNGRVEVVDYELQVPPSAAGGGCAGLPVDPNLTSPTLMRSEVAKPPNGAAAAPVFDPFLENVQNCTVSNPGLPIFIGCPAPPQAAPPECPTMTNMRASSNPAPGNTRLVLVRLLVQTAFRDPQTGQFMNIEQFGMAHRINPDR